MTARQYSNNAPPTTLAADATAGDVTITLASSAGLPVTFPYTLVIDPDGINAEVVTVTGLAGPVATVTRGEDNTTAVDHSAGVTVQHSHTARDFEESQEHFDEDTGVHGVGDGQVVGTTLAQILKAKTMMAATAGTVALIVQTVGSQTADAMQWKDISNNILARMSKEGYLTAKKGTFTIQDAAAVPLTVQGFTGQTAHLAEFKDFGGTVLSFIDAAGIFVGDMEPDTLTVQNLQVDATFNVDAVANFTNDVSVAGALDATVVKSPETTGSESRDQAPAASVGVANQTIATSSLTTLDLTTVAWDSESIVNTTADSVTPPIAGIYEVFLQIETGDGGGYSLYLGMKQSGGYVAMNKIGVDTARAFGSHQLHYVGPLSAATAYTFDAWHNKGSGMAITRVPTSAAGSSLTIRYLGPIPS